ncbi:MAG: cell division protein FtsI [Peptococcaceae bacterium]|nr:cell division protein FtsI [Peptococcaceae bacterium]
MNDNLKKLGYFFIALFSIISLYLGYINVILGPELATDSHNRRLAAAEDAVIRGAIYDIKGRILAQDQVSGEVKTRVYPLGRDGAHLIGFVSQRYGRTGAESTFDQYLLGIDQAGKIKSMLDRFLGRQQYGYDVILTVDSELQSEAAGLLKGKRGAVVALNPQNGDILALVSSPSFEPNLIDTVIGAGKTGYDQLIEQEKESAPLLNRAARGIYPPGSIFKIITQAGALELDSKYIDRIYDCKGSIEVDGFILKESAAHGKVDLNRAMAVSCNTYFASLGLEIGEEKLKSSAGSFGFGFIEYDMQGVKIEKFPVIDAEVAYNPGTIPANTLSMAEIASSAIGQGRLLTSPMQMALVASAVANGGVVMKPGILSKVISQNGLIIKKRLPEKLYTPFSEQTSRILSRAMVETVNAGTGTTAALSGVQVAGKTGSAQNPGGQTHAWFIGFAPADKPSIAIAVILENAGGGSTAAGPVARKIISRYLDSIKE